MVIPNKLFILAGGFGSRLHSKIRDRQKVMALLNGRPFLEILLLEAKRKGISQVILGLGYLSQSVSSYFGDGSSLGLHITYSIEQRPLGTAGAIKHAERLLNEQTFLVSNGDTLIDIDILKALAEHKKRDNIMTIVTTENTKGGKRGRVKVNTNNIIVSFVEGSSASANDNQHLDNTGFYLFEPDIFHYIPSGIKCSLERELIPQLLEVNKGIHAYVTDKQYIDIGTPENYQQAKRKLL